MFYHGLHGEHGTNNFRDFPGVIRGKFIDTIACCFE